MKDKRNQYFVAAVLTAPFVIVYLVLFVYPIYNMVVMSFTNAPLIGSGHWVGLRNYVRMFHDFLFRRAVFNTAYFVVLTVIPTTLIGLFIAMMVSRLRGWLQSIVLAAFFLPYILPVTVVYLIWQWALDQNFGIAQYALALFNHGHPVNVLRSPVLLMPMVAFVTIWWTNGFNILLFIAGLRNISSEIYDAASLDGSSRWQTFRLITWPMIWPVTALVLTIQLILQLKIFDQIYLFTTGGQINPTMVLVQLIYRQAFQLNHGGYGATIAVALFVIVVVFSVLQYQVLRARGEKL